jgi:Icc-related predicted phosphoesterase
MKILAIGDFHGKFPEKLRKLAKEVDVILSVGDFADTSELRKIEFKHWEEVKKKSIQKVIGKERYTKLLKQQSSSQQGILETLSKFKKPIFVIYGNSDLLDKEAEKFSVSGLKSQCKKLDIKLLKKDLTKFNNLTIAGFSGYRGAMSKKMTKASLYQKIKVFYYNKKWNRKLNVLSKQIKETKNVIFLAHDVPYGYFDKINNKESPLNNQRIGDKFLTDFIQKSQPELFLCGHMHEYQGIKKLGKTKIIEVGPAYEGKGVIIDFNEEKGKVRTIKFVR